MNSEFELPESWPEGWTGNTVLDVGDSNRFSVDIITDGSPHIGHIQNFTEIVNRLPSLFPQAKALILEMIDGTAINTPLENPHASLDIHIPGEPIGYGAEWSLSAKWYHHDGWFQVEFVGWEINPDDSQPYY